MMSEEVPMEAFTLVASPLPIPTACGLRLWFQGMTIFPSATMRRTNSGETSSFVATAAICAVRIPSRACSIWVFTYYSFFATEITEDTEKNQGKKNLTKDEQKIEDIQV